MATFEKRLENVEDQTNKVNNQSVVISRLIIGSSWNLAFEFRIILQRNGIPIPLISGYVLRNWKHLPCARMSLFVGESGTNCIAYGRKIWKKKKIQKKHFIINELDRKCRWAVQVLQTSGKDIGIQLGVCPLSCEMFSETKRWKSSDPPYMVQCVFVKGSNQSRYFWSWYSGHLLWNMAFYTITEQHMFCAHSTDIFPKNLIPWKTVKNVSNAYHY
jgi:hypothetical protein